MSVLVFEIKL